TGVAPQCSITLAVATKVSGVVITSSPGPTPRPASARWSAAVHEFVATACSQPTYSANSCSKRLVFGPVPSQPERSVSTTSSISSSPIAGAPNTIGSISAGRGDGLSAVSCPVTGLGLADTVPPNDVRHGPSDRREIDSPRAVLDVVEVEPDRFAQR